MTDRSRKRPRDPNQLGKLIADIATGEVEDAPDDHGDAGRRNGHQGGKARAEKLSPEKRSEIAKKAAAARWGSTQG